MKTIFAFLTAAFFIITVYPLLGTTILIQEPEVVIKQSPLIIEAVVKDIRFRPLSNLRTGEVWITLSVVDRVVGDCPSEIVIRRDAVTPDLHFLDTEWLPTYSIGERLIICLLPTLSGYSTMGLYNGNFVVERGYIKGTQISVEEFKQQIRQIRDGQQPKFPEQLPRQTPLALKRDLSKQSGETRILHAGSHLGGEFVTWDFTWDASYLPVIMHYNSANAPNNAPSASSIASLASTAYGLWADTYSFLTFQNASPFTTSEGFSSDDFSVILWQNLNNTNVLARTAVYPNDLSTNTFYGPNSNTGVDLRFNPVVAGTWYFSQTAPASHNSNQIDFIEILAHELGHGIGLQHVSNTGSIMYAFYLDKTGPVRGQTDGDLAARVFQHTASSLSGTFSHSMVLSASTSSFNLTNNLTVPSGKAFEIESGKTINSNGNYKLRVEGTLSADGVTFTRSGGTWYGIEFWNGAWLSEIRWANINNAEYGVRMYNTNVVLEDNSIKYNTTGLRFENQSDGAGIIRGNVVAENNDTGIECVQYSDPLLFSSNLIRYNNFYGVYGDNTSAPDLGRYSDQGHNSIYYNGDDVWSTYGGTIYALYNWWGEYPAYPTVSYNVDYSNALSYDPNPGLGKAATNALSFENPNKPLQNEIAADTLGMTEVNQAHQAFLDGKLEEALALFDGIIQKYPDHFSGRRALAFLDRTLGKLNRQTESFSRLNTIAVAHPSLEIAGIANSIAAGHLIKSAQYTEAVAKSQTILNGFPKTTLAKYALYDLGSIYWYRLADSKTGETYYRQLIAEWPEDDLSISALATLGEWKPKPNQGGAPILAKAQSVPTAYALAQNFPNPFLSGAKSRFAGNPQTLIQYQLPEASRLTLKIYNLFGQEIRTLFAGQREAGYHSEIWNGRDDFGRNVASGMYFYRLSTAPTATQPNGFSYTRKMVLMQ